ncbi:MAG: DUF2249 domain-containing protein [Acidimicrobiales bacterium]
MATLDVRPILAAGEEPFDLIMRTVAELRDDEDLIILSPFEPVPLEGVLGSQGFDFTAVERDAGDWHVTFSRIA